jgi:hypothetical protein
MLLDFSQAVLTVGGVSVPVWQPGDRMICAVDWGRSKGESVITVGRVRDDGTIIIDDIIEHTHGRLSGRLAIIRNLWRWRLMLHRRRARHRREKR